MRSLERIYCVGLHSTKSMFTITSIVNWHTKFHSTQTQAASSKIHWIYADFGFLRWNVTSCLVSRAVSQHGITTTIDYQLSLTTAVGLLRYYLVVHFPTVSKQKTAKLEWLMGQVVLAPLGVQWCAAKCWIYGLTLSTIEIFNLHDAMTQFTVN